MHTIGSTPVQIITHHERMEVSIKNMKNFFGWRKPSYPSNKFKPIEDKNWSHKVIFSYWTHHQPYDISEEGSHTWWWSNYSIKDSWSAWFERRRPIGDFQSTGSLIGNQILLGLMMCSGASDDISIFTWTRGHWISKIRQTDQPIKRFGPTSNTSRVLS
jgi:hypothetical protein